MACAMETRLVLDDDVEADMSDVDVIASAVAAVEVGEWEDCPHLLVVADAEDESTKVEWGRAKANLGNDSVEGCNLR